MAETDEEAARASAHPEPQDSKKLPPRSVRSNRSTPRVQTPTEDWTQGKKNKYNYHSLANLVAKQPGFAILRRFSELNAKNILYMQAELAILEDELAELEHEDLNSDDVTHRKYQWEAYELIRAPPGEDKQWQKILEIRAKLKEYNLLLLQQQRLNNLPGPNSHDLSQLHRILDWEEYGGEWLEPPEDAWSSRFEYDLVALSARSAGQDRFDRWLAEKVVPFIHRRILHRKVRPGEAEDTTYEYSDKTLRRFAEVVMIIIAALLPSVPVIALNYIPSILIKLLFVVAFSFLFSVCLVYFTSATRPDIFAVVTALASVQVVFIGTST
jgi:hypothetical protein